MGEKLSNLKIANNIAVFAGLIHALTRKFKWNTFYKYQTDGVQTGLEVN